MTKFKIGDRVKCIKPERAEAWCIGFDGLHSEGIIVQFREFNEEEEQVQGIELDNDYIYPEDALELVEQTYTLDQLRKTFNNLEWGEASWDCFNAQLNADLVRENDPQYQEYLRLKRIYE